jgi:hypothetical protein
LCQLLAAHSWHHDISNQQLDRDVARQYIRQGLVSSRRLDGDIPCLL